jgi:hypothetical protein
MAGAVASRYRIVDAAYRAARVNSAVAP